MSNAEAIASHAVEEITLPVSGRYLLLSDLHLGNGRPTDLFGDEDRALLDLLSAEAERVDGIILNGDGLDGWQAPTPALIRRAHRQVIHRLAHLAQRTRAFPQRRGAPHGVAGAGDRMRGSSR